MNFFIQVRFGKGITTTYVPEPEEREQNLVVTNLPSAPQSLLKKNISWEFKHNSQCHPPGKKALLATGLCMVYLPTFTTYI